MTTLTALTPELETQYSEFLRRDSHSLIYSSLEYRNFLQCAVGGEPNYLLALDDSGGIAGALPLFLSQKPGLGCVVNSLPWYGSHGGCIVSSGDDAPALRQVLLQGYKQLTKDRQCLLSTIILSPFEEAEKDNYSAVLEPVAVDARVGQITSLPQHGLDLVPRLEAVFAQKTRNLARKSLKQGFSLVRSSDDWAWDLLYQVHQENMLAIGGKAKLRGHFDALRTCLPEDWRQISVAMLDGQPVAALLLLYFNKTVEYFTPVIRQEFRARQPLSFLIWHGMLDAIERGYAFWNWGGTWHTQHSLHHFKAGWGAVDHPYTYLISASKEGLRYVRENRQAVLDAFPYYYIFPFDQL